MLGLLATVGGVIGVRYIIAAIPNIQATTVNRIVSAGAGVALMYVGSSERSVTRSLAFGAGIGSLSAAVLWPVNKEEIQKREEEQEIKKRASEEVKSQLSQLGCATCKMSEGVVKESLEGCLPCMAMLADQYSDEELVANSATMFNV